MLCRLDPAGKKVNPNNLTFVLGVKCCKSRPFHLTDIAVATYKLQQYCRNTKLICPTTLHIILLHVRTRALSDRCVFASMVEAASPTIRCNVCTLH